MSGVASTKTRRLRRAGWPGVTLPAAAAAAELRGPLTGRWDRGDRDGAVASPAAATKRTTPGQTARVGRGA